MYLFDWKYFFYLWALNEVKIGCSDDKWVLNFFIVWIFYRKIVDGGNYWENMFLRGEFFLYNFDKFFTVLLAHWSNGLRSKEFNCWNEIMVLISFLIDFEIGFFSMNKDKYEPVYKSISLKQFNNMRLRLKTITFTYKG